MTFLDLAHLKKHITNEHIDSNETKVHCFRCDRCEYSSSHKAELDKHTYHDHGYVTIKCEKCEYEAIDIDVMRLHMKKHTGRILFQCNHCDFKFANRHARKIHERIVSLVSIIHHIKSVV